VCFVIFVGCSALQRVVSARPVSLSCADMMAAVHLHLDAVPLILTAPGDRLISEHVLMRHLLEEVEKRTFDRPPERTIGIRGWSACPSPFVSRG
jgi:hypothetical protein